MKKKVVILSAFLSPFRSGAEACAEEVAGQLKDQYDITIITARLRKDLPYLDHLPSGVRVWRVGIGHAVDKWLYPFLAPRAARALKPDIIHAVLETFAGLALKRCDKNVRRILTCQTTNRGFMKKSIVRSADTVTVISNALKTIVEGFGKEAVLIPNGIRLHDLQEATKKRQKVDGRILYVGRLEPMKGIDMLLSAFSKLRVTSYESQNSQLETLQLRIVGDGSQREKLEKISHDLGIADRVTFVGYIPADQVAKEFAEASIFCGLSRSEALGNVFIEAQAAGCAVVATNVGGIPDIVHDGETGLLVPADNAEAATQALQRLIDNKQLHQQLAEAGKKNAEKYDWKSIAEKYATIYDQ